MERSNVKNELVLTDILNNVVEKLHEWIIISDHTGAIIYANEAVYNACFTTKESVLGEEIWQFIGMDPVEGEVLDHIKSILSKGEHLEFVSSRCIKGSRRIYLSTQLTVVYDQHGEAYYVCLAKDITSTERLKEEVYKASYFDALTQYPNHKMLLERLGKQLQVAAKANHQAAIILIGIRGIGEINTLYGMHMGDHIIKAVGSRIKKVLMPHQEMFKYKGDAYAVIEQGMIDEEQQIEFLMNLSRLMEEPVEIHNHYMYIEFKAGVAVYPQHGLTAIDLIESAQVALVHAKKYKSIVPYTYYSKNIKEENENSFYIEADLQQAVEQDEFIVYYQPFMDLEGEALVGMEALIRRQKPDGEIVFPGKFIEHLEKLHLIEKVGIRIIEKVCMQLRVWMDKGYKVVPVSINLSAMQLQNPNLAQNIKDILKRYSILPEYIVLEITETTVMEDVGMAQLTIDELKNYGFSFSIDDFGTGYASIGYLKKLMFDHLKIDISFVKNIVENEEDRSIVEAIIRIAKALRLKTVAEGIESEEQLAVMSALGCEMGQGFFWDRPSRPDWIEEKYFNHVL